MVSVVCEDDEWTYFYGGNPVYTHRATDLKMFRFITAQLVVSGACKQVDIINCFGVSKNRVLRSVNKLRNEGAETFFKPRKRRRGGTLFTPEVLEQAQGLLNQGLAGKEISGQLGIRTDTLRKAISDGRLQKPVFLQRVLVDHGRSKPKRDQIDSEAADV